MNINVRIKRFHQRRMQNAAVTVPPWADLQKMTEDEVKAMADRLGIEYTDRMGTLSEINKRRG